MISLARKVINSWVSNKNFVHQILKLEVFCRQIGSKNWHFKDFGVAQDIDFLKLVAVQVDLCHMMS